MSHLYVLQCLFIILSCFYRFCVLATASLFLCLWWWCAAGAELAIIYTGGAGPFGVRLVLVVLLWCIILDYYYYCEHFGSAAVVVWL